MIIQLNCWTFKSWYFQIFHSFVNFFLKTVFEKVACDTAVTGAWCPYCFWHPAVASVPVDVAANNVHVASPVAMLLLLLALLGSHLLSWSLVIGNFPGCCCQLFLLFWCPWKTCCGLNLCCCRRPYCCWHPFCYLVFATFLASLLLASLLCWHSCCG